MKPFHRKAREFIEFAAVLALIGCGVWLALTYLRHEKEEGSAIQQLRRIAEEAQQGGWIKDSNGAWSLPENIGTKTTGSKQPSVETNKAASGEKLR